MGLPDGLFCKERKSVLNEAIHTILNHRSIRDFQDKQLTDEQIKMIVACAQAASTSSFIQAYSIIGIKDKEKKAKLAHLAGDQRYVLNNGHFFVFCADLHRHFLIGELEQKDVMTSIESTEKFMVALIDASLAAQNAAVAAESMGLGICYIGGIRNNLDEVKAVLKTPEFVIPLFGMAVGYPEEINEQKPRLPLEHVYHEEEYQQNNEVQISQLQDYDEIISRYYQQRTNGKRGDRWTAQMASMLENPKRMYMKEFIEKNRMNLK